MNRFRFLNWEVYQSSREIVILILKLVKKLPKEYRFELGSQIIRAAFSIALNIAEGSAKSSDRELNRYLEISLGSISELVAALDVLKNAPLITQEEFDSLFEKLNSISSQLGGFKKKLAISHSS